MLLADTSLEAVELAHWLILAATSLELARTADGLDTVAF